MITSFIPGLIKSRPLNQKPGDEVTVQPTYPHALDGRTFWLNGHKRTWLHSMMQVYTWWGVNTNDDPACSSARSPLVSSTLMTTTHSFLPIRTSLLMERMRRRDSSLSMIMPSMLLYSSKLTYAPISAMERTFTITTSSSFG